MPSSGDTAATAVAWSLRLAVVAFGVVATPIATAPAATDVATFNVTAVVSGSCRMSVDDAGPRARTAAVSVACALGAPDHVVHRQTYEVAGDGLAAAYRATADWQDVTVDTYSDTITVTLSY